MAFRTKSRNYSSYYSLTSDTPFIWAGLTSNIDFNEDDSGFHDEEGNSVDADSLIDDGSDDDGMIFLSKLGPIDPEMVLHAIDEISDKYLTNVECDLIWLMRQGRRPVEISRVLSIPECEVVRLRRNCFRKIRVVFTYDYFHDKKAFLEDTKERLKLNEKQARILHLFFEYHGLRPIAEAIGTRPSNIHRSLESIYSRLDECLSEDAPSRAYLPAFQDLKYLNLRHNTSGS